MRRFALWSAALIVCAAAVLVPLSCQRVTVAEDWTPGRLHAELERSGRHFVSHRAFLGLLLKRPDDPTPWEELEDMLQLRPKEFCARRGRLYVNPFQRVVTIHLAGDEDQGTISLRHLLIRGHPEDLREIREMFGD